MKRNRKKIHRKQPNFNMIQLPDQHNTRQTNESPSHYFIDTNSSVSINA